jgi:hypothetical protein
MSRWFYDAFTAVQAFLDDQKWSMFYDAPGWAISQGSGVMTLQGIANSSIHAYANMPPALDSEVLVPVTRQDALATQRLRINLRSDKTLFLPTTGSERTTNCLALLIDNTGAITLNKYVGGTGTTLSGPTTLLTTIGTKYWVRFGTSAGRIHVRVWPDGTTEPGTWNIDVADDGTVPAGVLELVGFRSTVSALPMQIGPVSLTATGLPTKVGPALWRRLDGSRVPYGRVRVKRYDDCLDAATPSWITGTLSLDSAATRKMTAAGNTTASLSLPAVDLANVKSLSLMLGNLRVSADTAVALAMQFVGSSTWEMRQQNTATSVAALATPDASTLLAAGATTKALMYRFLGNSEGPRHRKPRLQILPEKQQLLAFEADQCVGWLDLAAIPTGAVTPTVTVTATGASARDLNYAYLELELERL